MIQYRFYFIEYEEMSLFTDKITKRFRKATRLLRRIQTKFTDPVDGREKIISKEYRILNRKELLAHIKDPRPEVGSRATAQMIVDTASRAEIKAQDYKAREQDLLQQLLHLNAFMCEKQVNRGYTKNSTTNSLNTEDYDILAIVDDDLLDKPFPLIQGLTNSHEINTIVGFIIAQRGECPKYDKGYVVNLICTRAQGISKFLLGGYLYAIKSNRHLLQYGILELAGAFGNLDGFCAYGNLGFVLDPDIFTPEIDEAHLPREIKLIESTNMTRCLNYSSDMLPMSVNLSQYENLDDIIYTLGSGNGIIRFGSGAVCDRNATVAEKDRLKRLNAYLYLATMLSHEEFRNNGWELTKIPYQLLLDLSVEIARLKNPIALAKAELLKIGKAIENIGKHCISILIAITFNRQAEALDNLNKIFTTTLTDGVLANIIKEINNLMNKVKLSVMPKQLQPLDVRTRRPRDTVAGPGTVTQPSALAMVAQKAKGKIKRAARSLGSALGFAHAPAAEVIGDDAVPMQGTASGRTASGRTASSRTASSRTATGQRTTKRRRKSSA